MEKEVRCVLSSTDYDLLKKASKAHADTFYNILDKIPTNTKSGNFICNVLGDYIYDLNTAVYADAEREIARYWDGNVNNYTEQLFDDIKNARYSVINLFLFYLENIDDLNDYEPSEMGNISQDYLFTFGTAEVCSKPESEEIDNLSELKKSVLNYFLVKTGFKEVK